MRDSSNLYSCRFYHRLLVESMLSFDVSVIDIVLAVAVVILLCLHLVRKPNQPKNEVKPYIEEAQPLQEDQKVSPEPSKSKTTVPNPQTTSPGCLHSFGYLRSLPKNTPVPDECFGCPNVMRCLFQDK